MSVDGAAPVRVKMKEIVPEYSFLENAGGQEDDKAPVEISVRKAAAHG